MVEPRFYSSRYCVNRAKYHINEFQRLKKAFVEAKPYTIVAQYDSPTNEGLILSMKLTAELPTELPGLVFDTVSNLRAALDQMMFSMVGKFTYFPFGDDISDFENNAIGRSKLDKKLPVEIFDCIRQLKPYKGGNDFLWSLNKLCNTQKHGTLIPAATNIMSVSRNDIITADSVVELPHIWNATNNEIPLYRVSSTERFKSELKIGVDILFSHIPILEGKPVAGFLIECLNAVDGIVGKLEDIAVRIGAIQVL